MERQRNMDLDQDNRRLLTRIEEIEFKIEDYLSEVSKL